MFSQDLYREVKRKLRPGHKGNPEVRFEIKIDEDVYDIICMCGIDSKARGTKFVTENLTAILVNAGTEES